MKRAKIILTALGIIAIVGGAVASRARKAYGGAYRCTTTTAPTSVCSLFGYSTTVTPFGTVMRCTAIEEILGTPCNLHTVSVLP